MEQPGGRGPCGRYWCFTLNNPEPAEWESRLQPLLQGLREAGTVVYAVVGREAGASGTPHLQGYVELAKKQRITWLKANVSTRAHYEIRTRSGVQAADYCKKDGDYMEVGEPVVSQQGKRTDIEEAQALLDSGQPLSVVAQEHFGVFLRYERSLRAYATLQAERRNWITEVYIFWGATGTGKTREVWEREGDNLWVAPDNSLKWFDGYENHAAVLFDDFVSVKNERFGFLLQLLDRYPMRVPIKGGFVNWAPRRVYFTSNLRPSEWYTGVSESSLRAFRRRITKSVKYHAGLVGLVVSQQEEETDW